MPKFSKEREQEYLERVRAIIVRLPNASIRIIQETLEGSETSSLKLDKDYVRKLVKKIRKDAGQRLNSYTVNVILGQFEREAEELKKTLWKIIAGRSATDKDKIAAIKQLRDTSVALFDKMFDAGLFEKNLGKLDTEHSLSEESELMIQKAIDYGYRNADKKDSGKSGDKGGTS